MNSYQKIKTQYSHENQILQITLNAPKGNVLDKRMMSELNAALQAQGKEASIKAIVFQGEGEHFSFGASVQEHQKEFVADMLATFHALFKVLIEISKPTISLVRGQCLGGGLELAAFCNWIFASEDARFGQPEINLAVFPPVASLILPYRIGQSMADDLVLSGRSLTAQEAKEAGLVYSISTEPEKAMHEFINHFILPKSAIALEFAVKSVRYEMYRAFMQHIDALEKLYVQELMESEDANEGIKSFLEKRKPIWKNK